ncbi:SDR family NAD(P)-dependent oxidoreductase, partial [Candidatus Peregrinibacteria bacterium]|nr:SDR family NAD(P)-dependent oxidoreductase [Candidatus Peregrinibacteria bacterium]
MDISKKVTIVTGASKGIGRAIALKFAEVGSDVVVAGRDTDGLQCTVDAINGLGRRALPINVDVTDSAQVNKMIEQAVDKFSKVDVLVNNAGISSMAPLIDLEEKAWDDVLNVNAKGVFLCCKAAAKQMIKQK